MIVTEVARNFIFNVKRTERCSGCALEVRCLKRNGNSRTQLAASFTCAAQLAHLTSSAAIRREHCCLQRKTVRRSHRKQERPSEGSAECGFYRLLTVYPYKLYDTTAASTTCHASYSDGSLDQHSLSSNLHNNLSTQSTHLRVFLLSKATF